MQDTQICSTACLAPSWMELQFCTSSVPPKQLSRNPTSLSTMRQKWLSTHTFTSLHPTQCLPTVDTNLSNKKGLYLYTCVWPECFAPTWETCKQMMTVPGLAHSYRVYAEASSVGHSERIVFVCNDEQIRHRVHSQGVIIGPVHWADVKR